MKRILILILLVITGLLAWHYYSDRGATSAPITALAAKQQAFDPNALSSQLIPNTDLPPAGTRSLFDHLMAQANGVPYPFEKLISTLKKLDAEDGEPLVLLIPDGRSLLKADADFVHPRIVAALDFSAPNGPGGWGLLPKGQLFLGFTEKANEIEVISYNEAAGRFEFQLVQDYSAKGARKLVYAKRAICGTCHQGNAPIFSVRPWAETNAQPAIAAKIAEQRQLAGLDPLRVLGFPTAIPLSIPERYDELTDVGNFFTATQKLWIDTCGAGASGASCRRQMLKLAVQYALSPGDFKSDSPEALALIAAQKTSNAPLITVPESDLPSRDPLLESAGLSGFFNNLFKAKPDPNIRAKDNEDLASFDKLPKLPAALDPLTVRAAKRKLSANDIDGIYGLASLLSPYDADTLLAAFNGQKSPLFNAIDRLPDTFFAPAPFQRIATVNAILALTATPEPKPYCCLDTSEMSSPVASGEPPVVLAANSPLKHFAEYCFACHRGNPSKRLNFMSGPDEATVLANIKSKSEIRDALDWERYTGTDKQNKLMPPEDSQQHADLRSALQADPKILEQMRTIVPALFDF